MWKFYKAVILSAFKEVWTATEKVLTVTAVLSFLAILANRKFGEKLVTTWNGISPWWSVIPISLLVSWRLLKANYMQFVSVKAERDTTVTKLISENNQLKTQISGNRPFIAPRSYQRGGDARYGLTVTNSEYAGYDVHIPGVPIGNSGYTLHFDGIFSQLLHNEEAFFPTWLHGASGISGDGLFEVMRQSNVGLISLL